MTELDKVDNTRERDEKGRLLPGQESLNPSGRPKFSLIAILKEELQKYKGDDEKETRARIIIRKAIEKAERGDTITYRDIVNRIDGMPTQKFGIDEDDNITEIDIKIRKNETKS